MMRPRPLAIAAVLIAAGGLSIATSAWGVAGGRRTTRTSHPYIVEIRADGRHLDCSGALVAPDRIVTAGHCAPDLRGDSVLLVGASRERLHPVRIAYLPLYVKRADRAVDPERPIGPDVVMVQLDKPAGDPHPVPVGRPPKRGSHAKLVGFGSTQPNHDDAGPLRAATLEVRGDRECRRRLRRSGREAAGLFDGPTMTCTIDPDGRAPFRAGCYGDSGGPLVAGRGAGLALVGVDSWGVACGTDDGDPEVFADVTAYAGFVGAASPSWVPIAEGQPQLAGTAAVGQTVTCQAPEWTVAPAGVEVTWRADGEVRQRGASPDYAVTAADANTILWCAVRATDGPAPENASDPVSVGET